MGAQVVDQHLGRLDVEDDLGARMAPEEVAGEQGQDQVGLVAPPPLVDHPHAIGVAIVGDARIGRDLEDFRHEVEGVLLHLGIGQVIGKVAVGLAVELDHVAAEAPQQLGGEAARDAIARVHHDLERPRHVDPRRDRLEVLLAGIAARAARHHRARSGRPGSRRAGPGSRPP